MIRRILAIDPGLMTGMCVFEKEAGGEPVLIWSKEVTEDEFAFPIRWELANYPHLEIVCERFTITQETAKKTQAPYSLELIGVVRQCLRDVGRDAHALPLQMPKDAKSMFPNPALKKLGYWHRGGAGHALDAIRHGLLFMVTTGWTPSRLLND